MGMAFFLAPAGTSITGEYYASVIKQLSVSI